MGEPVDDPPDPVLVPAVPSSTAAVVVPVARPDTSWTSSDADTLPENWTVIVGFVPTSPAGVSSCHRSQPDGPPELGAPAIRVKLLPAPSLTVLTVCVEPDAQPIAMIIFEPDDRFAVVKVTVAELLLELVAAFDADCR